MAFDPSPYLMSLKGKQYLPVQARLLWFREEHPNGDITTELVRYHEEDKMWVVRALVTVPGGGQATGHKQETERDFPAGALEKAETGAIGRALAALGYGTAYALELDEGERLADSPAQPAKATATKTKAAPQSAENERQQAVRLNARITALCTALAIDPPQGTSDLAALGQSFGWPLAGTGAASATWKEQLIVRLEVARQRAALAAALGADPDAKAKLPKAVDAMTAEELDKTLTWLQNRARRQAPALTEPEPASDEAPEPTASSLGEPWTEPDVLNALAAATEKDIDGIAAEIGLSVDAFVLTEDLARQLRACVTLARRAFTVTAAESMAQVEIDAGEMRTNLDLTVDQYDALRDAEILIHPKRIQGCREYQRTTCPGGVSAPAALPRRPWRPWRV